MSKYQISIHLTFMIFLGEYGIPKPWYFLFTRSYWFGSNKKRSYLRSSRIGSSNLDLYSVSQEELVDDTMSEVIFYSTIQFFLRFNEKDL